MNESVANLNYESNLIPDDRTVKLLAHYYDIFKKWWP